MLKKQLQETQNFCFPPAFCQEEKRLLIELPVEKHKAVFQSLTANQKHEVKVIQLGARSKDHKLPSVTPLLWQAPVPENTIKKKYISPLQQS